MDNEKETHRQEVPDNVVHVNFGSHRLRAVEPPVDADPQQGDLGNVPSLEVDRSQPDLLSIKKFRVFEEFIDDGMVMLTLDTRVSGVQVPPQFKDTPELRLNFSHLFHVDDFSYDEHAVCASLSFQGKPFYCVIPWQAVSMIYNHEKGTAAIFEH